MKQYILITLLLSLSSCSGAFGFMGGPAIALESTSQREAVGYNDINKGLVHGTMAGKDMSKFRMQKRREVSSGWFGDAKYINPPKSYFNGLFNLNPADFKGSGDEEYYTNNPQ